VPDDESPLALAPTDALPVAPSLSGVQAPPQYAPVDARVIYISALAIGVGAGGALIADVLTHLIGLITNIAYYGRAVAAFVPPRTPVTPGAPAKPVSTAKSQIGAPALDSDAFLTL